VYGKPLADMESVIARNELKQEFNDTNKPLQRLAGEPGVLKDPDDNLSSTVYTKGAWFMQFLEQRFGRENFDAFLRGYFDHFAFQSISSQQFADYAKANLLDKYPGKVTEAEFNAWLHDPGVPSDAPQVASPKFDASMPRARRGWTAARCRRPMPQRSGRRRSGCTSSKACPRSWTPSSSPRWMRVQVHRHAERRNRAALVSAAVRSGYTQANAAISAFLQKIGRRKLIMPTYNAWCRRRKASSSPKTLREGEAGLPPDHHRLGAGRDRRARRSRDAGAVSAGIRVAER
jgi:hypothetical protein